MSLPGWVFLSICFSSAPATSEPCIPDGIATDGGASMRVRKPLCGKLWRFQGLLLSQHVLACPDQDKQCADRLLPLLHCPYSNQSPNLLFLPNSSTSLFFPQCLSWPLTISLVGTATRAFEISDLLASVLNHLQSILHSAVRVTLQNNIILMPCSNLKFLNVLPFPSRYCPNSSAWAARFFVFFCEED